MRFPAPQFISDRISDGVGTPREPPMTPFDVLCNLIGLYGTVPRIGLDCIPPIGIDCTSHEPPMGLDCTSHVHRI